MTYCRELAEDEGCLVQSRGMAGLQDKLFVLKFRKGLETLRQRHIETVVRERFTIVGEISGDYIHLMSPSCPECLHLLNDAIARVLHCT